MTKSPLALIRCLGIAALIATSGCTLYFGDDGYYDDGYDDGWSDDGGFYCSTDTECAAGCYCGDYGYCEESGYCNTDTDCGEGFQCDEARNTCDPDGMSDTCTTDDACAAGCYCDPSITPNWGGCAESCYCSNDAEAIAGGYGYCDEDRSTCMPGTDPNEIDGSCAGELTCNLGAPTCDPGSVPLIKDGCYTGECLALAQCDAQPTCEVLNTEANCLDRAAECTAVYTGTNCTTAGGTACQSGDSGCTCASYQFNECRAD